MVDEILLQILSQPFQPPGVRELPQTEGETDASTDEPEQLDGYEDFENDMVSAQAPHSRVADFIREQLFSDKTPTLIIELFDPHEDEIKDNLNKIDNLFNIYLKTIDNESLEREADKFKHRYFNESPGPGQFRFIKALRYYEKVKSFNETAKATWFTLHKIFEIYVGLQECKTLSLDIQQHISEELSEIQHRTDYFLRYFNEYLKIINEKDDPLTHSYNIEANYDPLVNYDLTEIFRSIRNQNSSGDTNEGSENQSSSIAQSIVIETKERQLNQARIFSTLMIGSRDWNRTPHYSLEVNVDEYRACLEKFNKSYQVNWDPADIKNPLPPVAALSLNGAGAAELDNYINLLQTDLEEISAQLLTEDFPGLEQPLVFLYHCGPRIFYAMLIESLHLNKLGDIFYMEGGANLREMPEELIKKELIEWWNSKMSILSSEDVDSYMTFSRAVDMVKKQYRSRYESGIQLRKTELPHADYSGTTNWIKMNQGRIFGSRRIEIYKRFLNETIFD